MEGEESDEDYTLRLMEEMDALNVKEENVVNRIISSLPEDLQEFFEYFIIPEDYDVAVKDIESLKSGKRFFKHKITEWFDSLENEEAVSNLLFLCVCVLNKELKGEWNREMIDRWIPSQSFLYGTYNVDEIKLPENVSSSRRGLNYKDNSCYQDSVLMCLFAIPNYYITQQILEKDLELLCSSDSPLISRCVKIPRGVPNPEKLKREDYKIKIRIQQELRRITNYIRGDLPLSRYTCSNLREVFSLCGISDYSNNTETQDAGLFIKYLFNIFNVDIAKRQILTYYYTDALTSSPTGEEKDVIVKINELPNDVPILDVPLYAYPKNITLIISGSSLKQKRIANLYDDETKKFPKVDGVEVKTQVTIETINTPYIIFTINRTPIFKTHEESLQFNRNQEAMKLRNKVVPEETLILTPSRDVTTTLYLHGIVVHKDIHYTCFIKIENVWYYYNDMEKELQYIGGYDAMINSSIINPTVYGTVFFYS